MSITDLYQLLFGKNHIQDGDVISMSEHGRVGGVSTGQGFKFNAIVDPVSGNSPTVTDGKLNVNAAAPVGGATSAKQDTQITNQQTIQSLIETLQELNQRLAPLGGAMAPTAQLRAVVTGAVTATGGGYITSAQAITALLTQTNTLWINNTMAIQSNINNVVITT